MRTEILFLNNKITLQLWFWYSEINSLTNLLTMFIISKHKDYKQKKTALNYF